MQGDRPDQIFLVGEAAIHRRLADTGARGDLRDGGIESALREDLDGGRLDAAAVAARIGPVI